MVAGLNFSVQFFQLLELHTIACVNFDRRNVWVLKCSHAKHTQYFTPTNEISFHRLCVYVVAQGIQDQLVFLVVFTISCKCLSDSFKSQHL